MKKSLLITTLFLLLSSPSQAQSVEAGIMFGISESANSGLDLEFNDDFREAFVSWEFEPEVAFKLKAGRVDTAAILFINDFELLIDGEVEYIDALVEYRFEEVYGTTAIFAGPGYYRQDFGEFKEADWGYAVGLGGEFPITRKIAFVAEATYHSAQFEDVQTFVNIGAGFRVGF